MKTRTKARTAVLLLALAGAAGLEAPARAGGGAEILNPAFGNGCTNQYRQSSARGSADSDSGTVSGNLLGAPVTSALNQCGNADAVANLLAGGSPGVLAGNPQQAPAPPPGCPVEEAARNVLPAFNPATYTPVCSK